jgi:cysteine-rich repeat protein
MNARMSGTPRRSDPSCSESPSATSRGAARRCGLTALFALLLASCTPDEPAALDASVGLDGAVTLDGSSSLDGSQDAGSDAGACVTPDGDGDGSRSIACGGDDCDDTDRRRFPGNTEVCDSTAHDEDCDATTFGMRDADMDGAQAGYCCNVDASGARNCGDDCDDARPSVRPGASESCNNRDDDCDGTIDEDTPTSGVCSVGRGVCLRSGSYVCEAGVYGTTCGATPGAASDEACNGLDDDCDGMTDEEIAPSGACAVGVGACARMGVLECSAATFSRCSVVAGLPSAETCNGVDDDCNGSADDLAPALSELVVSCGSLSPAFAGDTVSYTVDVPSTVPSCVLTPSVSCPAGAALTVDGETLASGTASAAVPRSSSARAVEVVVTNTSGATRNYSVVVRWVASCGDGLIEDLETCDDGNTTAGDGCSASCEVEAGYTCAGTPSVCAIRCGDGVRGGLEGCDDGNTTPGDGCATGCAVEPGFTCVGSPSVCAPRCGDGVVIGAETCDDGFTQSGDGCSATCRTEAGFNCITAISPSVCSFTATYVGAPAAVADTLITGTPGAATTLSLAVSATLATCRLAAVETTHAWSPRHTYANDIALAVRAPNGSVTALMNRAGGSSDLVGPYTFAAVGTTWPPTGDPLPAGSYRADYAPVLGSPANGTWQLVAQDYGIGDTGSISAFSLTLRCRTAPP